MLQQTPVARVLPVFVAWLERWPTPADLALDSPGAAVRAWGRLGYPRRALRLHACATRITADHNGEVPNSVAVLLELPGIGEYTARAVAAFAYGQRTPVVDTNVRRVLCRAVRGVDDSGPATAADRALMTTQLPLEAATAARFSAAVMELGALVCTAAKPDCARCPLRAGCNWLRAGKPPSPIRRTAQVWSGTDRQVRGRIMALLRESAEPLTVQLLTAAWPEPVQWHRCLDSLLADGLAERTADDRIALPG